MPEEGSVRAANRMGRPKLRNERGRKARSAGPRAPGLTSLMPLLELNHGEVSLPEKDRLLRYEMGADRLSPVIWAEGVRRRPVSVLLPKHEEIRDAGTRRRAQSVPRIVEPEERVSHRAA